MRTLPHNEQAEKSVLGSVLIEKDILFKIADVLKPDDFFVYNHEIIYKNMIYLYERGSIIDLLTITEQLKNSKELSKIGGQTYLVELTNNVFTTSNIVEHAFIIKNKSTLRKMISCGTKISEMGYDEKVSLEENFAKVESLIPEMIFTSVKAKNSAEVSHTYMQSWEEALRLQALGKSEFILTGFKDIDEKITLMREHLTVLMARSSIGKSALALNLAMGAVEHDSRVLFITLEMTENEVMNRILSYISEESNTRFKYRSIDPKPHLEHFSTHYKNFNLIGLTNCDINRLSAIITSKEYDMIIIDYLGYMSLNEKKTRNEAIGDVTRKLKMLARQRKCNILLLSQVRRTMPGKAGVPDLEDLRDSGNIEQDADEVLALHREDRESTEALLVVRKGRTGAAELAINLSYRPEITKFEECDPPSDKPISNTLTNKKTIKTLWN